MSGSAEASSSKGKKTKGRQKIKMQKIEKDDERMVAFSKRKSGICNKSSELVALCGAEVCFTVFSPTGTPFSFGHPSVESVVNRFMGQDPPTNDNTHPLVEANRVLRIEELNQEYNETQEEIQNEMEKSKFLEPIPPELKGTGWWEAPLEKMRVDELQLFEDKADETLNMAQNILLGKMTLNDA